MNTMYSYGVMFCIPPAGHPSNLAGAVHRGTRVFLCGVGLGTCAHGREVRLQRLSMSSVILADTVVQTIGERKLTKEKEKASGVMSEAFWSYVGRHIAKGSIRQKKPPAGHTPPEGASAHAPPGNHPTRRAYQRGGVSMAERLWQGLLLQE